MGYEEKKIIVCGRSMGSGPSTYVASVRKPGAMILISGFLSLRAAVKRYNKEFKIEILASLDHYCNI